MKQVLDRIQFSRFLSISLLLVLQLISLPSFSQEAETASAEAPAADLGGDPVVGKQLFNQNCAACHALNRKMTGPALANVESRLAENEGLDKEWLYKWIKNSAGMIASGDAYANKIYNEYNQSAMTAFPTLSNEDIDNILAYTAAPPPAPKVATTVAGDGGNVSSGGGISNEIILGALALVFGLLVVMLFLVNNTLRKIAEANGVKVVKEQAEQEHLDNIFVSAGFEWRLPGCSMCLGMNDDILAPGDRCASTSNRNFEGRQGRGARTHLVSPQMAAAAAIAGHFVDVRKFATQTNAGEQ